MALKFSWQSTSATQAIYATGLRDMARANSNTALTLTAGGTGCFGGTYLDTTGNPRVMWCGHDNGPVGSQSVSILIRNIPTFTTTPASSAPLFCMQGGDANVDSDGIWSFVNTSGKLVVTMKVRNSTFALNDTVAASAFTFTSGVPNDIWMVWGGSASASFTIWQGQNGFAAALVATLTPGQAVPAGGWLRALIPSISNVDIADSVFNTSLFNLNEIAIFDSVEVPSSYGARTGFVYNGAAYEGYTSTALATNQVRTGVAYGPGPGSLTGTYAAPYTAASNVRSGTDRGDGTTGTLVVPIPATVVSGVATDNTTGTFSAASKSDIAQLKALILTG